MIGRTNRPESEITRRIDAIRASAETTFRDLLRAGEFDLKSELRFRNLSGMSFAGDDLREIDFTGANLSHCDFSNALIEGARFDLARIGLVVDGSAAYSQIEAAQDWAAHVAAWTTIADVTPPRENFFPVGAIFRDSPMLPPMVVVPFMRVLGPRAVQGRIAISQRCMWDSEVKYWSNADLNHRTNGLDPAAFLSGKSATYRSGTPTEVRDLVHRIQVVANQLYRLPAQSELDVYCHQPSPGNAEEGDKRVVSDNYTMNGLGIAVPSSFPEWCMSFQQPSDLIAYGRDGHGLSLDDMDAGVRLVRRIRLGDADLF